MVPDAENLTDLNGDTIDLGDDNINCSYPLLLDPNETRLGVLFVVRAPINGIKRDKLLETAKDPDKLHWFIHGILNNATTVKVPSPSVTQMELAQVRRFSIIDTIVLSVEDLGGKLTVLD